MKKAYKLFKKDIYNLRYVLIFVFIYIIFMQINFGTVCISSALFNIPCPACNLTHAGLSLLCFNFKKAFSYNPNIFLWFTYICLLLINRYIIRIKINLFPSIFILFSIINITWYIIYVLPYIFV